MRTSSVVVLSVAASALAAPTSVPRYHRRATAAAPVVAAPAPAPAAPAAPAPAAGGGKTAILNNAATGAALASSLVNIGNQIAGFFRGDKDKREVAEFIARAVAAAPAARPAGDRLGDAANVAGIASGAVAIGDFFNNLVNGNPQAKRQLEAIIDKELGHDFESSFGDLSARDVEDLMARKFSLSNAANIAGLASAGLGIGNFLGGLLSPSAKREVEDALEARKVSLGNLANIAGLASAGLGIGNFIGGLLSPSAKRELDDALEARKVSLTNLANVAGLASAGLGIGNFIGGLLNPQARDFDMSESELEARKVSLGNLANIAGLASAGLGIGNFIGGLFGGEKRELSPVELQIFEAMMSSPEAKRELEERKFNLGAAANIAGLASAGLGIGNFIGGLFGGEKRELSPIELQILEAMMSSPEAKRELEERKFNLGTAANIAGLASAGLGIGNFIGGLFGGEKRELTPMELEILDALMTPAAKRELEERKFNLGTAANIAGLGAAGLGIGNFIGGLFQRDVSPVELEILAALMTPEAKRELEERKFNLGTAANVAGLASAGLGIGNFLGGLLGGDQAKRAIIDAMAELD